MDVGPGAHDRGHEHAAAGEDGPGSIEQRVGLAPRRWSRPLRVLLALAGSSACDTARAYLELDRGFAVVGTAPNGHRALALAAEVEPDVAVVDGELPAGGLAVIPALRRRSPGTVVVALADLSDLHDLGPASVDPWGDHSADGADVWLGRWTPLMILADVLADLAVRLDQEKAPPLRDQWPAHVPVRLARWAEGAPEAPMAPGAATRRARPVTRLPEGPGRAGRSRRSGRRARPARMAVAAGAAAALVLSGGVVAAASGSLPGPAQSFASRALAVVHLTVPDPRARHAPAVATTAGRGSSSGVRGPAPGEGARTPTEGAPLGGSPVPGSPAAASPAGQATTSGDGAPEAPGTDSRVAPVASHGPEPAPAGRPSSSGVPSAAAGSGGSSEAGPMPDAGGSTGARQGSNGGAAGYGAGGGDAPESTHGSEGSQSPGPAQAGSSGPGGQGGAANRQDSESGS